MSKAFSGKFPPSVSAVPLIMAGGSGTRFWPLSRQSRPKQFLPLPGGSETLIEATARRLQSVVLDCPVMVVTSKSQSGLVSEHIPEALVLSEPEPKNTGPCLAFAALWVMQHLGDVPMVCVPADHAVKNEEGFASTLRQGLELVKNRDSLVTVGIAPTHAETGYGYIRQGSPVEDNEKVFRVECFVEKPQRTQAEKFLSSGDYLWNSGMFFWRPSVLLGQIARHAPELAQSMSELRDVIDRGADWQELAEVFSRIKPVSIDHGLMEKADDVLVIRADSFGWNDVGTWQSWSDCVPDSDGVNNYVSGDAGAFLCSGVTVLSHERYIAAVGLKDVVIVDSGDCLLVCGKDAAQEVKLVVESLKQQGRRELL